MPDFSTIKSFFARDAFRKEILAVIVLKLIALMVLWMVCFSVIQKEIMTPAVLAYHFLK